MMIDLSKVTITPMLKQYLEQKKDYTDCILFFRLGDFYEMFLEDALLASKELDLTLTGRGKDENRIPMCGVPYHAAESYINRLVTKGYKVAICEQVEDANESKGLTQRAVTKILTPGTILNEDALDAKESNYLAAYEPTKKGFACSFIDSSTGEFYCSLLDSEDELTSLFKQLNVKEIIQNDSNEQDIQFENTLINSQTFFDLDRSNIFLCDFFKVQNLSAFGIEKHTEAYPCIAAICVYLKNTQKTALEHIKRCSAYYPKQFLQIDTSSIHHLELLSQGNDKKESLFWVLNHCKTAMGARRLNQLIRSPFISEETINKRLNFLEALYGDVLSREEIRESLHLVYDIERLISRITSAHNNPKDLLSLHQSLTAIEHLPNILSQIEVAGFDEFFDFFENIHNEDSEHQKITALIENSIREDAPQTIRDGGVIKPGYDKNLDDLLASFNTIREWINGLEEAERSRTGIKMLKVGFNKVFGYYFQISHSYKGDIPEEYIRKQTLTNAERYISPELKEKETILFNGEEKQSKLEAAIYESVIEKIKLHIPYLQNLAKQIADLDCFQSLALASQRNNYCRPEFVNDDSLKLEFKDNRHPVLEQNKQVSVIPNDIFLNKEKFFVLITGPNMAGKSTLMRQVALTVVMAQIACFVPASEAKLSIVDKLFTRIGASDNLFSGQSTFMTEMLETSKLLHNSTRNSLIILDEIGRGTSTYDGISIAGAVTEYIHNTIGCRSFFATHYHELTSLNKTLLGLKNASMSISEDNGKLVFTYQFKDGAADKSYGIHVAQMAGIPEPVIERAKALLSELEQHGLKINQHQLSLF